MMKVNEYDTVRTLVEKDGYPVGSVGFAAGTFVFCA
jgi:hypothetical protein